MGLKFKKLSNIIGLGGKHKTKDNEANPKTSLKSEIVHKSQSNKLEDNEGKLPSKNFNPTLQERCPPVAKVSQAAAVEQFSTEVQMNSVPKEDTLSGNSIHFSCTHSITDSQPQNVGADTKDSNLESQENNFNGRNNASEYSDQVSISLDLSDEDASMAHSIKSNSKSSTPKPSSIPLAKKGNGNTRGTRGMTDEAAFNSVKPHSGEHVSKNSSVLTESRSISFDRKKPLTNTSEDASASRREQQSNKIETTLIFRSEGVNCKHVTEKEAQRSLHVGKINTERENVRSNTLHKKAATRATVSSSSLPRKRMAASNGHAGPPLNPTAHVSRITRNFSPEVRETRSPSMSSDRHPTTTTRESSRLSRLHSPYYVSQSCKRGPLLNGSDVPTNEVSQGREGISADVLEIILKCTKDGKSLQRLNRNLPLRVSPHQQRRRLHNAEVYDCNGSKIAHAAPLSERSPDYLTPERHDTKRKMHRSPENNAHYVGEEYEPLWGSNSSTLLSSSSSRGMKTPLRASLSEERSSRVCHRSAEHQRVGYARAASSTRRDSYERTSPSDRLAFPASPRRYSSRRNHTAHDNQDFKRSPVSRLTGYRLPRQGEKYKEIQDDNSTLSSHSHCLTLGNLPMGRNASVSLEAKNEVLGHRYVKSSPTRMPSHRTSPKATSSTHISPQREPLALDKEYMLDQVQDKLHLLSDEIANHDRQIEQDMRSSPWKRLYHHSNRRDWETRGALVAQYNKLAKISAKIENGTFKAESKAREERLRKQEELLKDPNGVYLRLYNARRSARASEGSRNTSRGSSPRGNAHSSHQRGSARSDALRSRGKAATSASPSVSSRSADQSFAVVQRTEAQRAAFFRDMYTRSMNEVRVKDQKTQMARKEREKHDLEEFLIARLAARVELDLLRRRHSRNTDPLAVAQRKWEKEASKDDSTMQAFVDQLVHGPKLSSSEEKKMASRLTVQGYIKAETLQKRREKQEIKGCTFHPSIISHGLKYSERGSAVSPKAGSRRASDSGLNRPNGSEVKSLGQKGDRGIAEKRCNILYQQALRERKREEQKKKEHERQRCLEILKSRLSTDHHFKRRVELNPSLAEHFMNSLSI